MRRLLISAAVLALATTSAFAQPGRDREHGNGGAGGPGPHEGAAPQTQGTQSRAHVAPPADAPRDAPRMQGTQSRAHVTPPAVAQGGGPTNFTNQIQGRQPDQGQRFDRGNGQGRGDRGGPQTAPQLQAAPQAQPGQNRPGGQPNFGNRDNNGRDFRGGDRRQGGPSFNGPRRDYSGFRDFHRDFRSTRRFRIAPYRPPAGFYSHRWTFGEFLPQPYWARDYWLMDFAAYGLEPPPYGAVWVRVGSDALLIDEYSGEVITVAYDVFY